MAGNTFGTLFRVTTWGESHGTALGAVIDGCPPGLDLTPEMIQQELERRRPGKGGATSPRKEPDKVEIMSGIFQPEGAACPKTTGTPISLVIFNQDAHSKSYSNLLDIYRPGHGDFSYQAKYGIRDHRGGGLSLLHNIWLVRQVVEAIPLLGSGKTDYTSIGRLVREGKQHQF